MATYQVQQGETLSGIAKKLGYSNWQEAGFSGYKSGNPDLIHPGEMLTYNAKPSALVATSTPAKKEGLKYSQQLTSMLGNLGQGLQQTQATDYSADPFIRQLEQHKATSDDATKMLISNIQASAQAQKADLSRTYEDYKRGLQLLGIQHNEAQFTPDLLAGHITQVQNEYQGKLSQLNAEQAKLLMDARKAQADNDLSTLKEKMERMKELDNEKRDALKDLYDRMNTEQKIADLQAGIVYDELQKLGENEKEVFLQELSKRYGIPLNTLVASIAKEAEARKTGGGKGSSGKVMSLTDIQRFKELYGIDLPYGTTEAEAMDILNQEGGGDEGSQITGDMLRETYSTKQLFKIANALGIERKTNLTRQDEIERLVEKLPDIITELKNEGYSDDEIAEYFDSLT